MKKIGIIGCGNIANAIVTGAITSNYIKCDDIIAYDLNNEKLSEFENKGVLAAKNEKEVASFAEYVFLTVKPQVISQVIETIKNSVSKDSVIVTPAAGVKMEKIKEYFGKDLKVVRVMPNTPLMYLQGATAAVRGNGVSEEEFKFILNLFSASGKTVEVEEQMIDAVTGISGSSPAFFMRFAKDIIDVGVKAGLSEEKAKELVIQTMLGTAKMVTESENSIEDLIKAVASPNGTTEAGLNKMNEENFDDIVSSVITRSIERSIELSKD